MFSRTITIKNIGDERHIYLYAKNHYPKSKNVMNDLKKIVSRITSVPYKLIDTHSVVYWVSKVAAPHMGLDHHAFIDFIVDSKRYQTISAKSLVKQLLSVISCAPMYDMKLRKHLIDIGDVDISIFETKSGGSDYIGVTPTGFVVDIINYSN